MFVRSTDCYRIFKPEAGGIRPHSLVIGIYGVIYVLIFVPRRHTDDYPGVAYQFYRLRVRISILVHNFLPAAYRHIRDTDIEAVNPFKRHYIVERPNGIGNNSSRGKRFFVIFIA